MSLAERFMEVYTKAVLWITAALAAVVAADALIGYTASYWSIAYDDAALVLASLATLLLAWWKSNFDKRR